MKKRIWPILLATAIGVAILCSLGAWQVKRLAWKEALIAEVDQRMAAAPVPLTAASNTEYLHVTATGRFLPQPPLRRMASSNGGPGYGLLHPFLSSDGILVLVDRGTIAMHDKDPAISPASNTDVTIDGIIRLHDKGRGTFDADNDVAGNVWIWWDIPAMLKATNPPANSTPAHFILQLVPSPGLPPKPHVAAPKAELHNNHLGYAITWFGLAAALVGVAGVFVLKERKQK